MAEVPELSPEGGAEEEEEALIWDRGEETDSLLGLFNLRGKPLIIQPGQRLQPGSDSGHTHVRPHIITREIYRSS